LDNFDYLDILICLYFQHCPTKKNKPMNNKQYNPDGFIPKHGGYKSLIDNT